MPSSQRRPLYLKQIEAVQDWDHMSAIRLAKPAFIILCLSAMAGCATMEYPFSSPEQKRATVRTEGNLKLRICKDGALYAARFVAGDDYHTLYEVPADGKLALIGGGFHQESGYRVLSCTPRLAFIPKAGERYIYDTAIGDSGCPAYLVREDQSAPIGIAPEPSVSAAEDMCP